MLRKLALASGLMGAALLAPAAMSAPQLPAVTSDTPLVQQTQFWDMNRCRAWRRECAERWGWRTERWDRRGTGASAIATATAGTVKPTGAVYVRALALPSRQGWRFCLRGLATDGAGWGGGAALFVARRRALKSAEEETP
jgi:hypothetical protein